MGDSNIEKVYPLASDAVESKRLNLQHHLLYTYCEQNLIDPSVAIENLEAIADIATGTGVWLDHVSEILESTPTKSGNKRLYDGFDISSVIFPAAPQNGISFHMQDMFQPFPVEFHGKYDFIHIRFVIGAIKGDTYKIIVKNVLPLLKLGGYIQWDDLRWPCVFFNSNPTLNEKDAEQAIQDLMSTDEILHSFFRLYNISCELPELVEIHLKEVGLQIITKHDYTRPDTEARIEASREYRIQLVKAMMPVLIRIGKTEEEAEAILEKDLKIFEKYFPNGWYSSLPVITVVAQKA